MPPPPLGEPVRTCARCAPMWGVCWARWSAVPLRSTVGLGRSTSPSPIPRRWWSPARETASRRRAGVSALRRPVPPGPPWRKPMSGRPAPPRWRMKRPPGPRLPARRSTKPAGGPRPPGAAHENSSLLDSAVETRARGGSRSGRCQGRDPGAAGPSRGAVSGWRATRVGSPTSRPRSLALSTTPRRRSRLSPRTLSSSKTAPISARRWSMCW